MRIPALLLAAAAALLAGCAAFSPPRAAPGIAEVPPPVLKSCPAGLPVGTRCFVGLDTTGAFYAIGVPAGWNRELLIVHAHGGPELDAPTERRALADLKRWEIAVKAGHAWVGTTYRRGGYGWTQAFADVERSRLLFVRDFGAPRRTILHGQSYGGGVAAKGAELASAAPSPGYDALLLTSAMLGGALRFLEFRFDLRVVYQYVCRNHPRAEEPQYPLWMGLPADSILTRSELSARIHECTGVQLPSAQRSARQQANLADILNVIHIREDSLVRHVEQATWLFRDLTQLRLGGRNPFDNMQVVYRGSSNDAVLNAGVQRYASDPSAVADLARDSAPEGKLRMPVLTLHAIDDPTAFVELESGYRQVLERAGTGGQLVQVFSDEREHSYLSDPEYPALFTALLDWIDKGDKPTPQKVLALCLGYEASFGKGCRIQPDYTPKPMESRVAARQR